MLPYTCLDSVLYSMELAVFYPTHSQNSIGEVVRSWQFDRLERCSVKSKRNYYAVAQQNQLVEELVGQSEEDLRIDSDGIVHPISEILVFVNSPKVYFEIDKPTLFEVRKSTPILGAFQEVLHFDIELARSLDQSIDCEIEWEL